MQTGMLHLHGLLRWVILILLIASMLKSFGGWKSGRSFGQGDRRIWLFTFIATNIMFLVGLYLLLWGTYGILTAEIPEGESVMSNKFFRFFWVEHPVMMLVAVALISIAYGKAKKAIPDTQKFKQAFWLYLVALLLILVSIPWPFREVGANRGWM